MAVEMEIDFRENWLVATVEVQDTLVFSVGLGGSDVELRVPDRSRVEDGEALVRTVVDYVEGTGRSLRPGETFGYGYWLVRFDAGGSGRLSISEYAADASQFVPGADLALRYWREQHEVCERFGAPFTPPRADQMVAVSVGVYEGDPVQGVRYHAPDHMTGWYATTARFNGDTRTLTVEHLYHLTAKRPDLARYVALPPGYRFDMTGGSDDVWFDVGVAAESS